MESQNDWYQNLFRVYGPYVVFNVQLNSAKKEEPRMQNIFSTDCSTLSPTQKQIADNPYKNPQTRPLQHAFQQQQSAVEDAKNDTDNQATVLWEYVVRRVVPHA